EARARSRARSAISLLHSRRAERRGGSVARARSLRGASFTGAKYETPPRRVKASASRLTPQRVDQGRLQVLEQYLGFHRAVVAEETLQQNAVQRRHDEAGVQTRRGGRAERPILAAGVDDVHQHVVVEAMELVHVPDEVVRTLL